jgi:hypothetical protein
MVSGKREGWVKVGGPLVLIRRARQAMGADETHHLRDKVIICSQFFELNLFEARRPVIPGFTYSQLETSILSCFL